MSRSRGTFTLSALCLIGACSAKDEALTDETVASRATDAGHLPKEAAAEPLNDAEPSTSRAADPDCDLNGLWIARQQTVNVALGLPQTANNWYFYELSQDGEEVVVVDHFDCGIEVLGTVHVQLRPQTIEALIPHNLQAGRKGKMSKNADGTCDFQMERFWSVRGAVETKYVPDRTSPKTPNELAQELPLPTPDKPEGAEDWDADGELGIAWVITGIASGERHSIQRDYTEWQSDAEFKVQASRSWAEDLTVRSRIGSQEILFAASSPTLSGSGTPDASAKHRVTFHFLGRNRKSSEVAKILKSTPLLTCEAIRAALPAGQL